MKPFGFAVDVLVVVFDMGVVAAADAITLYMWTHSEEKTTQSETPNVKHPGQGTKPVQLLWKLKYHFPKVTFQSSFVLQDTECRVETLQP